MKNYIRYINRRDTDCCKWDSVEENGNLVPLWIADMDIATPKPIVDTIIERAKHPAFGYVKIPNRYYETVCQWFENQHEWHFEPKDIFYTTGVIPAFSATIKALVKEGQKVIMMTPVYNHFFIAIKNNGVELEESPLIYENNTYTIDFKDFEKKCANSKVKMLLLCNPHNPVGRCWTKDELTRIAKICKRNGVFILSDEIHCEIVMPNEKFNSFGPIGDEVECNFAVTNSPSKTFNTASLQIANIICKDKFILDKIKNAISQNECRDVNPFGFEALITAYTNRDCKYFIQDLGAKIYENYNMVKNNLEEKTEVKVTKLEGTYLMWINISCLNKKSKEVADELLRDYKVWVMPGTAYGDAGEGFLRINLATSPMNLQDGMDRFIDYYNQIMGNK